MKQFTAQITWGNAPDDLEEIDVQANSVDEARYRVVAALQNNYEPGWTITVIAETLPEVQVQSWKE